MSEKVYSEFGKLIIDLLIGFERLQYTSAYDKVDNPNSIYLLYSSTLRLIGRVISPDVRDCRLFRLKYHHILSNDSVDEYLFHCLSKILADLLDIENSYQRFIQPVAELHMKLMSILTKVQLEHERVVLADRRVAMELLKRQEKISTAEGRDQSKPEGGDVSKSFIPVYFLPSCCSKKKLKKNQSLTFHAIHSYYTTNHSLDADTFDMLLDFDNAFAEFELDFVCQVNKNSIFTINRAELTMDVAVLFAEAVQWAHGMRLLQYRSIGDCDIELMVGIPRLAVLYGCIVAKDGPLSEWSLNCRDEMEVENRLAPAFQDHRQELCRLRRQLNVLNATELNYLCQLLMDHSDLPEVAAPPADGDQDSSMWSFKSCGGVGGSGAVSVSVSVSGDMHALFKLVSSVSDQMQSQHASDYRFFMETVFKLYKAEPDSPPPIAASSASMVTVSMESASSSFVNVQSVSKSDSFPSSFHHDAMSVDEAVDALTLAGTDQSSSSSSSAVDIYRWAPPKVASSPLHHANPQWPRHQSASVRRNSLQIIDQGLLLRRPQWRSDASFPRCCHCERNFNVFRRKHHCRRCGYLFCSSCWGSKLALPALGIQNKVSICVECEEFLNGKGPQTLTSSSQSTS